MCFVLFLCRVQKGKQINIMSSLMEMEPKEGEITLKFFKDRERGTKKQIKGYAQVF